MDIEVVTSFFLKTCINTMITNIWLKIQPNKKLSYPDCYPNILINDLPDCCIINAKTKKFEATYTVNKIARVEFRPE